MIIRHNSPNSGWTKVDKDVFTNKELTVGAKVLYGFLCGLRNGENTADTYIMNGLSIGRATLTRWKKELKDQGLILLDQIGPRVYVIYIGHTRMPAYVVKQKWLDDGGCSRDG